MIHDTVQELPLWIFITCSVVVAVLSYYRQTPFINGSKSNDGFNLKGLRQPLLDGSYLACFGLFMTTATPPVLYGGLVIFLYGILAYWMLRIPYRGWIDQEYLGNTYTPHTTLKRVGVVSVLVTGVILLIAVNTDSGLLLFGVATIIGFITPLIPRTTLRALFERSGQKLRARTWILPAHLLPLFSFLYTVTGSSPNILTLVGYLTSGGIVFLCGQYYDYMFRRSSVIGDFYTDTFDYTQLNHFLDSSLTVNGESLTLTVTYPEFTPDNKKGRQPWSGLVNLLGILVELESVLDIRLDVSELEWIVSQKLDSTPVFVLNDGATRLYKRAIHRQEDTTVKDIQDFDVELSDSVRPMKNYNENMIGYDNPESTTGSTANDTAGIAKASGSIDVDTQVGDGVEVTVTFSFDSEPSFGKYLALHQLYRWVNGYTDCDDLPPRHFAGDDQELESWLYDVGHEMYRDDSSWNKWAGVSKSAARGIRSSMHNAESTTVRDIHYAEVRSGRSSVRSMNSYAS